MHMISSLTAVHVQYAHRPGNLMAAQTMSHHAMFRPAQVAQIPPAHGNMRMIAILNHNATDKKNGANAPLIIYADLIF